MSKAKSNKATDEVVVSEAVDEATEDIAEEVTTENTDAVKDTESTDTTSQVIIREGTAPKLRNTEQLIKYAIVQVDDEPCIQLVSNDGNGLFSLEPISITSLVEKLSGNITDKPFSSRIFHSLFNQQSNNNAGFLAAVLRKEDILTTAPKKQYLHQLAIPADKIEQHLTK